MNEHGFDFYLHKECRVFIRGLDVRPIIFNGEVISVDDSFIMLVDSVDGKIKINIHDIILIKEVL